MSARRTLALAALALTAALAAPPVLAAQDAASAAAPGRVAPANVEVRDRRLPKAEAQRFTQAVQGIYDRLLATPALKDPRGFAINQSLIVASPPDGMPDWNPARVEGTILLRLIDLKKTKGDAATGYTGWGEGPTIHIHVNDQSALFGYPVSAGQFFDMTTLPADRGGFPVLRFSMRDHVVIAKPGRLPYRHVTKQEVLDRELGDLRESVAKLGEHAAPKLRQMLADQEAELAALSPAERAAPACLSGSRKKGTFTPCGEKGATYVVMMDPDYFERGAGRGTIQLITISAPFDSRDDHKILGPVTRQAVEALDLRALQAMLE